MIILASAREIFDLLGGIQAVADLTGAEYAAAANWKRFGRFPPKTYVALQRALMSRHTIAPATLWGMVPMED